MCSKFIRTDFTKQDILIDVWWYIDMIEQRLSPDELTCTIQSKYEDLLKACVFIKLIILPPILADFPSFSSATTDQLNDCN